MKEWTGIRVALTSALVFVFTGVAPASRAQTGGLDLSQLQLVASNAIPSFANFYFAQNYGIIPRATGISSFGPPLPFDPRSDLPLYSAWSAATTYSSGQWSAPTYYVTRPTKPDSSDAFPFWLETYTNN